MLNKESARSCVCDQDCRRDHSVEESWMGEDVQQQVQQKEMKHFGTFTCAQTTTLL